MTSIETSPRWRQILLHLTRVLLFVLIIVLIHVQHQEVRTQQRRVAAVTLGLDEIRVLYPQAQSLADETQSLGRREVLDASGQPLGYVIQTSPQSDHLIGFSGPTNTLIAFDREERIIGIDILSSEDTRDHVAQVLLDPQFLKSFNDLTWEMAARKIHVDAVSGATLTSLTIQESVIYRLSGGRPSLRFPDPLTLADARVAFAPADGLVQDDLSPSLWHVNDQRGQGIGSILRSSPWADHIIGYQGPTETRIYFDAVGSILGIGIGKSYDNEPYVTYVRADAYFLSLFNGLRLGALANLDSTEAEVEGVSGATMTSMAVVGGLIAAAEQRRQTLEQVEKTPKAFLHWTLRDAGAAAVIGVGLSLVFASFRHNRRLRFCFKVLLIAYLGLINGDLLSLVMLVGWAQNGVPWSHSGGLVMLSLAAFLLPMTTRRNVYCSHLCPHGAAQSLLRNRLPWRLRLPHRLLRGLKLIPVVLLAWSVIVTMASLPFSLVDIEPFDAWVFRVAGGATIAIAVVGLGASLFVPMAYCRYGCPTGALLSFLRFHSRSDRWSGRDWFAAGLVTMATGLWLVL